MSVIALFLSPLIYIMLSRLLPISSFTLPNFAKETARIRCMHLPTRRNYPTISFTFVGRSAARNLLISPYSKAPFLFASKALQQALFYSVTTLFVSATVMTTTAQPVENSTRHDPKFNDSLVDDYPENKLTFPPEILQYDTYQGITLHVSRLPSRFFDKSQEDGSTLFERTLQQSLLQWKEHNYRGIWLHIPTHLAPVILPYCIQELNFDFRYARPGMVILTTWLPDPQLHTNKLPLGPTHQVGVGAVIIHPRDKNKILVVQEKSGPAAAHQLWKMPTGLTDPGEDIHHALVREVKEETGIHVQFQQIICFRQAHSAGRSSGGSLGHSDLFFVCLATCCPDSLDKDNEILESVLSEQHDEIAKIQWMDVEEYANQKLWRLSPLYNEMNDAVRRSVYRRSGTLKNTMIDQELNPVIGDSNDIPQDIDPNGFVAKTLPIGFRPGVNTIYVSKL